MAATISMTDYQVFAALRAWIMDVLPSTVAVIQELDNRVPMPKGEFVVMSRINRKLIEWSAMSYTDSYADTGTIGGLEVFTNTQPIDYAIQVDCYGPNSSDYSTILSTLWNTSQACDFMGPSGVLPLYNDDPKQMPFIDGEKQYQHRWVTTLHLQYNPAVSTAMQFASEAEVSLINVDRTYTI